MNTIKKCATLFLAVLLLGVNAHSEDSTTIPTNTTPSESATPPQEPSETKDLTWNQMIQKKYNLTDAQMQTLDNAKLNEAHSVRVAHLAQLSNKSIEEVLKLRTDSKMGWGQIAKELGVAESEIGKAVSSLRKERNELRQQAKSDKRVEREEKRKEKQDSRQAKKTERQEKSKGKDRK